MSAKPQQNHIDISVVITAHAEGILLHRTLLSVHRAIKYIGSTYRSEIILHVDSPTDATQNYIETNKEMSLQGVRVYTNSFGDLGSSRNYSIQKAQGVYIATIDADDIMCKNWLKDALDMLVSQSEPTVAHSEYTLEFEGANSLIIKHGEIDPSTDTLLSVYANRWNSVIAAPRQLLLEEPYAPNSPGFGYEDWHLNCRLIERGVHNMLVPKTAIFVRRRFVNSEWLRQAQSMAVLRANPLLKFSRVRQIEDRFTSKNSASVIVGAVGTSARHAKAMIKRFRAGRRALRVARMLASHYGKKVSQQPIMPNWLLTEWRSLHEVERGIFPSAKLIHSIPTYDTITENHRLAGTLYKQIIDQLKNDNYSYCIFVPWLIKGGADQYSINYANMISKLHPEKNVLVIATLPVESTWKHRLDDSVDFIDFGTITHNAPLDVKQRLLEHIIENSGITHLHIINSELGYDFVNQHATYIQATNKSVIATAFSQSIDQEGKVHGYSHTHVPVVYDKLSYITSDNQAVIDMWQHDYGFDKNKMKVHRQSIPLAQQLSQINKKKSAPIRILWAARISPEKQPELLAAIGEGLTGYATIDIFGSIQPDCIDSIQKLPSNVRYCGEFDGILSLPTDTYNAYLYTSLFDGMPNVLLEATQAGLPIIASRVGGIPEFINNKHTGYLVNEITNPQGYVDAVLDLIHSPHLADTYVKNARNKISTDFSPRAYTANVQHMLKTVKY